MKQELIELIKNLECPLPEVPDEHTTDIQIGFELAQEMTIKELENYQFVIR